MQRSIFPAVLAALAVSVFVNVVALLVRSDGREDFLRRAEEAEAKVKTADATVAILSRRLDALERRSTSVRRSSPAESTGDGEESGDGAGAGDAPGASPFAVDAEGRLLAPDGTPFVTQKALDDAVAKALTARGGAFDLQPIEPVVPKPLEDVAADMGLTAGEEAQLRIILRESEEEVLDIFFPGQSIPEIKQLAQELKDDPDRQAQFVQTAITRALPNIGKLATLESRRDKRVRELLGKERAQDFRQRRVKPIYGDDLEDVFDGILDR